MILNWFRKNPQDNSPLHRKDTLLSQLDFLFDTLEMNKFDIIYMENLKKILNEEFDKKFNISENLKFHIDNKITLSENIFRIYSKEYFKLINEVRELYYTNKINLNDGVLQQ